ncbi:hypothetical protein MKX03_035034 [Papaver bracteatum]|nr:hypothetical protein MKX03_035034 [Papaver bracteatum]
MLLSLISPVLQKPSSSLIIKSHLTTQSSSIHTQLSSSSPLLPSPKTLSLNPNNSNNNNSINNNPIVPDPSLNCALQCQHFDSCSGCTHEWNLHSPNILEDANAFFRNLGVSNFTFDSCRLWGWRCRAKLAVRGSSTKPLIGLYQEGTHNVVDIPSCQAHHPSINAAVELLKQGMSKLDVVPYDEDEVTGELRYVQVKYRFPWFGIQEMRLKYGADKLNALATFLWRNGGPNSNVNLIHSVWVNFQTSTNNIIFGNRWRHLLGEIDFWERVGGIDISLAPSSFGQANTRAFDSLLQRLHKYVPYGASVADMYAGAGVIGLSLAVAKTCRSVKCIEINKESKLSFEKTVSRLPKHLDSNISWHHADTSIDPLSWLEGSDVVVVDPPRKGLDPTLVETLRNLFHYERKAKSPMRSVLKEKDEKRPWILRAKESSVEIEGKTIWEKSQSLPETLIYISCGWESFKEDCRSLLSSKGWHLEKAHGFNFFPGTNSIEILAVFKRTAGGGVKKKKTGKKKKKKSQSGVVHSEM